MQFDLYYICPPWRTEDHTIINGARSNILYIYITFHIAFMLEFRPLLQHKSHTRRIIFHDHPNLPDSTHPPLSKVEVDNWLGHAYHRLTHINGECLL